MTEPDYLFRTEVILNLTDNLIEVRWSNNGPPPGLEAPEEIEAVNQANAERVANELLEAVEIARSRSGFVGDLSRRSRRR